MQSLGLDDIVNAAKSLLTAGTLEGACLRRRVG